MKKIIIIITSLMALLVLTKFNAVSAKRENEYDELTGAGGAA